MCHKNEFHQFYLIINVKNQPNFEKEWCTFDYIYIYIYIYIYLKFLGFLGRNQMHSLLVMFCHQKRGTQTTTRPLWLYCIACDWSSIQHTHINRACTSTFTDLDSSEPPANTIPAQGFQDGISQFRFAQKVSANTSVQPPRTSNNGLRSICPLSHSPPKKQTTPNCWSPALLHKPLCSTTSFLAGSDSFQKRRS
jgi:hypothetical protein